MLGEHSRDSGSQALVFDGLLAPMARPRTSRGRCPPSYSGAPWACSVWTHQRLTCAKDCTKSFTCTTRLAHLGLRAQDHDPVRQHRKLRAERHTARKCQTNMFGPKAPTHHRNVMLLTLQVQHTQSWKAGTLRKHHLHRRAP